MEDEILTLTHATERDIDLLLVEELICGTDLLARLVKEGFDIDLGPMGYRSHRVIHSQRRIHNRREIDICVEITTTEAKPTYLLIENKLDASEQADQSESYQGEAEFLVSSGRAFEAWTMLVSPVARPQRIGRSGYRQTAQGLHRSPVAGDRRLQQGVCSPVARAISESDARPSHDEGCFARRERDNDLRPRHASGMVVPAANATCASASGGQREPLLLRLGRPFR